MALDENIRIFVVHVPLLNSKITIYSACKAQIALLIAKEVTVQAKNSKFANVFSKELAKMLPKHTGIIKHVIKLEEDK